MYKAVLFDMDGTLVDSVGDLAEATNYALKKSTDMKTRPTEAYGKFAGNGVYVMIERALKPVTVSDSVLHELRDDFFRLLQQPLHG